jgi:sugar phosphate isomerase/epimerase
MVGIDSLSQQTAAIRQLADHHEVPVCAVHAPCLLITQRVWGTDPWGKLERSAEMAHALGADVVVVHPPFRWQRDYARGFVEGLHRMRSETDVVFAVENMYPWRARGREMQAYAPDWDVVDRDYPAVTLDLSHTAVSHSDPLAMIEALGDRLRHLHMADGSGSNKDEHLIPGRGTQPCAEVLETLAGRGFTGNVVLEVNTRRCSNRREREADLAEALAYTRLHLAAAVER